MGLAGPICQLHPDPDPVQSPLRGLHVGLALAHPPSSSSPKFYLIRENYIFVGVFFISSNSTDQQVNRKVNQVMEMQFKKLRYQYLIMP